MPWLTLLSLAVLPLLPRGLSAQSEADALALLERASARYEALTGLCARFSQELHVPLLGQTTSSSGEMCQLDPHFFRMDFADPKGDAIVADGTFLWMYLPSAQPGQVIRRSMGNGQQTMDFHREFLERPGVKYAPEWVGAESVDGRPTRHIRLIPREPSEYRAAEVWLDADEALILKIRIEQANGSVRTLQLSDLRLDPALDASDFAFEPPPGTHVVGP